MAERVIPLVDQRIAALRPRMPEGPFAGPAGWLADALGRPLRDLRISVTDRCNFRCSYCMPKEVFGKDYPYLSHGDLLSFEEITRLARVFLAHGVRKIRLTGGEPLLRRHLENLVEQLAGLRTAEGRVPDLTLTTNGSLLARKARALRDAGLARLTVSLDSLQDSVFRRMNDVDFPVAEVLSGIEAAQAAGFERIKVNMVVKRGTNDHEIVPMARHFRGTGITLRFIEYMDVGATNGWRMDEVLPSAQVIDRLRQELPWCSCLPRPPEKPPSAGVMPTHRAGTTPPWEKWERSAASPARSAAIATAPGCRWKAGSTCASSPRRAGTCARCCAAGPPTPIWPRPSPASGRAAPTAIPNCGAACRRPPARRPRGASR